MEVSCVSADVVKWDVKCVEDSRMFPKERRKENKQSLFDETKPGITQEEVYV